MWSPTHIQVTVLRAKGLLTKGKNATNNCFVTIGLGKEKYQTSLKEKVPTNVDWHEECELKIPDQGNRAELILTCLHRNNLGIDEFLGQAILPLNEMDVYDRPRSRWFKLESKPGKEKKKERGELEVRISFIVKSGSLTDLRKKEKHKSSVGQLASSVGGSLLSIGTIEKRKSLSKIAKSIGSKMHLPGGGGSGKKKSKENDTDSFTGSFSSIETPNSGRVGGGGRYGQHIGEADPGVISEDEDEFVFDNLSHKSSGSSLNIRSGLQNYNTPIAPSPLLLGKEDESLRSRILPPSKPPRNAANESPPKVDEWEAKLYGKHNKHGMDGGGGIGGTDSLKRRSWETSRVPLPQNTNNAEETDETESARDFKEAVEAEEKLQAETANTTTTTAFKETVLARASLDKENKSMEIPTETPFSTPQKEPKLFPEIKQRRRLDDLVNGSVDQQSSTAPSTPVSRRSNDHITSPQTQAQTPTQRFIDTEKQAQSSPPKPMMSRSATMECLSQKDSNISSAPIAVPTSTPTSFSTSNGNLTTTTTKDDKDVEKKETPPTVGKTTEKRNRFSKYKYFNKRDKNDFGFDDNNYSPIPSERIIIGHEKSSHMPRSEISAALEKKYDGKSREELMIIAHGMETEALIQRQRVKELEDYLDNLLLRVMETHPKILQNPYSQRITLAKSG